MRPHRSVAKVPIRCFFSSTIHMAGGALPLDLFAGQETSPCRPFSPNWWSMARARLHAAFGRVTHPSLPLRTEVFQIALRLLLSRGLAARHVWLRQPAASDPARGRPAVFLHSKGKCKFGRVTDCLTSRKLKLNNFNPFPYSTFNWVGLDGSQVLAHMSPVEAYNAQCD